MISLTIDGRPVEVPEGTSVLQAARSVGIEIPTLCDHPALTPYGGCRLCIVEIQGARGPVTSCTMPAGQGMVVQTNTPALHASRKFILDMLFSERNHFCPFCQESGGDCELQNSAYDEGMTSWDFPPTWKKFEVDASHPDFVLDHNRCILCRRCIRACGELVGNFTLTTCERGSATLVTADSGLPLGESSCVSCGMCVQVCPTGALIDRTRAYKGHQKDWQSQTSTCSGCSVGCGTVLWSRDNQLIGVDGDWNAPVNHGLLCHVGRYSAVDDQRPRLTQPLVRQDGVLKPVSWEEALQTAAQALQPLAGKNGDGLAALISTRLPAEDLALFRRLFAQGLGSHLVTSIEEGMTTAAVLAQAESLGRPFEGKLSALDSADLVLAVGVDLVDNHQVAGFLVKRRLPAGAVLVVVDPSANETKALAHMVIEPEPGQDAALIESLRQELKSETPGRLARLLKRSQRPVILYGKGITRQSGKALAALVGLCEDLNHLGKASTLLSLKGEANSLAAAQYGLDQPFNLNGQQAAYLVLGDDFPAQRLVERVANVPCKIVQAAYASVLTEMADVVLPVTNWAEQGGHFLSLDGRLQEVKAVLQAPQGARLNRDVLADLAACLNLDVQVDWKQELARRAAPVVLDLN